MAWVRLDDQFPDHPKLAAAGPLAGWLHVCALCYSNRHLTDGFVPDGQVRKLAVFDDIEIVTATNATFGSSEPVDTWALVERLIDVGVWHQVDGGFQIHDYLDLQRSRSEIRQNREDLSAKRRAAGRKGAAVTNAKKPQVSTGKPANGPANIQQQDRQTFGTMSGTKSAPTPTPTDIDQSQSQNTSPISTSLALVGQPVSPAKPVPSKYPDEFEHWWNIYPRKAGKGAALKAWRRAKAKVGVDALNDSASAYAEALATSGRDPEFIPHPATWLSQSRWDDPLPVAAKPVARNPSRADRNRANLQASLARMNGTA